MKIEIYTKNYCPYCRKAKELLEKKGAEFIEIDITNNEQKREEMIARSGRTTVPQIFINGRHIGGCDDLYKLEEKGELDKLLGKRQ